MQKLIAVCEFPNSKGESTNRQYEYLVELPDDANREHFKYAVTLDGACEEDATILHTKRLIGRLQVVFIREFREITNQLYAGELNRLVLAFGMDEFIEHAVRRQQISTLRANLERRLADLSVFEKIKAFGIKDDEINSMAEQLKKLMGAG